MKIELAYCIYDIGGSEAASSATKQVPLLKRDDGATVSAEGATLNIGPLKYDIHVTYLERNSALSLEISNETSVLVRFGGTICSSIGLGASIPSVSKHVEVVFSVE